MMVGCLGPISTVGDNQDCRKVPDVTTDDITKHERVLEWRNIAEWSPRVSSLMNDVLTDEVMNIIRRTPPNCFDLWDSKPGWLQDALDHVGIGTQTSVPSLLAKRLQTDYSHILVFHACRPDSVTSYYGDGFRLPDARTVKELVMTRLRAADSFRVSSEMVDQAIANIRKEKRESHLSFALDDRVLLTQSCDYLRYGSEFMRVIAAKLGRQTGEDYQAILRDTGMPTIFVCNLPLSFADPAVVETLSCGLVACLCRQLVDPEGEPGLFDLTFTISSPLLPEFVRSHYHPKEMMDPISGRATGRWSEL